MGLEQVLTLPRRLGWGGAEATMREGFPLLCHAAPFGMEPH